MMPHYLFLKIVSHLLKCSPDNIRTYSSIIRRISSITIVAIGKVICCYFPICFLAAFISSIPEYEAVVSIYTWAVFFLIFCSFVTRVAQKIIPPQSISTIHTTIMLLHLFIERVYFLTIKNNLRVVFSILKISNYFV